MAPERLLRKPEFKSRLNVGHTKFHELVNAGFLPKPVRLPTAAGTPGRVSYWPESVVSACVLAIAEQRLDDLRRIASQDLSAMFGGQK